MSNITLQAFKKYGVKSATNKKPTTNNAVIYTRVSTKEQAETNLSLETQKKYCNEYAQRKVYNVLGYFGGTYESAKTDERKEFKRMLSFVKKTKERVSYIIVYSLDRFSRTGANAIYLAHQLKKNGIIIQSVTQPSDPTTASGALQQSIQLIFSQYDNEVRREKIIAGMKERLLKGEWTGMAPFGYDNITINGQKTVRPNEQARFIKKIFHWKAQGHTNTQIINKLAPLGFKTNLPRLGEILKNPFYCGIIAHKQLDGEVINGKHETIISKELFLKVRQITDSRNHQRRRRKEYPNTPLNAFFRCDQCGRALTGFYVAARNLYYYKCNKWGCNSNTPAKYLHETFTEMISKYTFNTPFEKPVKSYLKHLFELKYEEYEQDNKQLKSQLTVLQNQIDTIEERYALGKIGDDIYLKYRSKYNGEKVKIEEELKEPPIKRSNLEECLNLAVPIALKAASYWGFGDFSLRRRIQYTVYPEGIRYHKRNQAVLTPRTNKIFAHNPELSKVLKDSTPENQSKKIADFASLMLSEAKHLY